MICQVCHGMLYSQRDRRGSVSRLELNFAHHKTKFNLEQSAEVSDCYICHVIYERLKHVDTKKRDEKQAVPGDTFLSASLRPFSRRDGVFRLDFRAIGVKGNLASFVLRPKDQAASNTSKKRPGSTSTDDPAIFELAKQWVESCATTHERCRASSPQKIWHPTRLLDLKPILDSGGNVQALHLVSQKEGERKSQQLPFDEKYVTLSHRWGTLPLGSRLTKELLEVFQGTLLLRDLPLTFQHAIQFTCVLGIRYIWIDAMCIVQDDEDDWLVESALMDKVYAHSYCNISATAATDSKGGLFRDRDTSKNWIEDVTLATTGLTAGSPGQVQCTILDLAFWSDCVADAPVNKRSWVLQERLLAPRVVHWCHNQIAFECRELDRAECRPEGIPHFQVRGSELVDGARLKGIDVNVGRQLRATRLAPRQISPASALDSMITELNPRYDYYELWKRIVEEYTKMELTKDQDRLIALSGIARMMDAEMKSHNIEDQYIAGLWKSHIASQLLWNVNEGSRGSRQPFENTRPKMFRAPSWSWASVETSRGVTFAEPSSSGLLVEIEFIRLIYRNPDDLFGMLTDGWLVLRGNLRRIEIRDRGPVSTDVATNGTKPNWRSAQATYISTDHDRWHNRYVWYLIQNGQSVGRPHSIVFLDSPATSPTIFGSGQNIFCLPVIRDNYYLTCLLLQAVSGDYGSRYQRIGLTRIATMHSDVDEIIATPRHITDGRGRYFWGTTEVKNSEKHTVCII